MEKFYKGQLAHATWARPKILELRPYLRGGKTGMVYQLTKDYIWKDPALGDIVVKRGFLTDGASIPKFAWGAIGHPFSGFLEAAVVHDMLYGTKRIFVDGEEVDITQADADAVFYRVLLDLGCSKLKARTMYTSLRMFGRSAWKSKEEYDEIFVPLMVDIEDFS